MLTRFALSLHHSKAMPVFAPKISLSPGPSDKYNAFTTLLTESVLTIQKYTLHPAKCPLNGFSYQLLFSTV